MAQEGWTRERKGKATFRSGRYDLYQFDYLNRSSQPNGKFGWNYTVTVKYSKEEGLSVNVCVNEEAAVETYGETTSCSIPNHILAALMAEGA